MNSDATKAILNGFVPVGFCDPSQLSPQVSGNE
jgi:hypothetical protein